MNNQMEPIFFTPPSGPTRNRRLYKGGGTVQTTSTSTPTIPDELKPLANLYVRQATDYANKPFQYYPGQRYAGLNDTQNYGLRKVAERAIEGSPTMQNAEGSLNRFISGGQTNPYLDQMVNRAQSSVVNQFNNTTKPQIESSMRQSGSFGNSGLQQLMQNQQIAMGRQLGDIATQMYGQAYNQDQANRMNAIQMAPTFGNAAYNDAREMLNAGNIRQQNEQNPLDFAYQQFQGAQDQPLRAMQATSGVLGQSSGSTSSGTQPKGGK